MVEFINACSTYGTWDNDHQRSVYNDSSTPLPGI